MIFSLKDNFVVNFDNKVEIKRKHNTSINKLSIQITFEDLYLLRRSLEGVNAKRPTYNGYADFSFLQKCWDKKWEIGSHRNCFSVK